MGLHVWVHFGDMWSCDTSGHQVVFEAVAGDGGGMDIAIDDLLILNGPCPPQGKWALPSI